MDFRNIKCYHFYATANDDSNFFYDIKNFLRLKKAESGVSKIHLLIAISAVKKVTLKQRFFLKLVKCLFSKKDRISIKTLFTKSNTGRDFSSFFLMFKSIKEELDDDDYIFFQNRSGYGPFLDNWYSTFIKQISKNEKLAICGSTINFRDHPNRSNRIDLPHVQTYAFLTTGKFLKLIANDFPGLKSKTRLEAIYDGEIEFSQFFIKKDYGITCIEWPENFIFRDSKPIKKEDIRGEVLEKHQFYHRGYFEQNKNYKRSKFSVFKTIVLFFYKSIFS